MLVNVNRYSRDFTCTYINILRQIQNCRHFHGDILKLIFFNENVWMSNRISLKYVAKGPINDNLVLFQIMAWRRPGEKPLSETMMVSLLTHKCVNRLPWVQCRWKGYLSYCLRHKYHHNIWYLFSSVYRPLYYNFLQLLNEMNENIYICYQWVLVLYASLSNKLL